MSRPTRPTLEEAQVVVETATGGRDGITRHVHKALTAAYERGLHDAQPIARAAALREQLAILRGIEQDARARAATLERELLEMERSR